MRTSKVIKAHTYETDKGQRVTMWELADGMYHADGTARIYTKEQAEAGFAEIIRRGGYKVQLKNAR